VHVLSGGTSIFDDSINGFLNEKSFSDAFAVAAGDTIDFAVGYGNGSYGCDSTGIEVTISLSSAAGYYRRGDANADGAWNIADAVFVLGYLFGGDPDPACMKASDTNDDGKLNIADAVSLLGSLFGSGPEPGEPFAACGADPSDDTLTCASFAPCQARHGG